MTNQFNDQLPVGLLTQLVRALHQYRRGQGDSRLCMKALLESKISRGFEGFEDFICTGLYGFVPSLISSGTVRCYNRSQNLFSINP